MSFLERATVARRTTDNEIAQRQRHFALQDPATSGASAKCGLKQASQLTGNPESTAGAGLLRTAPHAGKLRVMKKAAPLAVHQKNVGPNKGAAFEREIWGAFLAFRRKRTAAFGVNTSWW